MSGKSKVLKITSGIAKKNSDNVVVQKITRRVRILFYGGALKVGDNSAFQFAANNVRKDYFSKFPHDKVIFEFVDSARTIVDTINNQSEGKIISLDLFFHGSKWGLYIYKGASMNGNLSKDDVNSNNLNAGLYGSKTTGISATNENEEIRTIYNIDFSRFSKDRAVIEMHGCESGGDLYLIDSISKNLSEQLLDGYVIGHLTKANPNINGTTVSSEQDDRHGRRAIWKNGEIIKETVQQKWLNPNEIE